MLELLHTFELNLWQGRRLQRMQGLYRWMNTHLLNSYRRSIDAGSPRLQRSISSQQNQSQVAWIRHSVSKSKNTLTLPVEYDAQSWLKPLAALFVSLRAWVPVPRRRCSLFLDDVVGCLNGEQLFAQVRFDLENTCLQWIYHH